ncbi:MAG: hydantoinase [Gemmatimonadetes bacterium]|nr:MAG: hydantoinase [Gemmatimonadota bacterium]
MPHLGGGEVAVRVGVDVGGTFTDLVALAEDGTIEVRKVVTTPDDPAVGLFQAVDGLRGPIELLIHGTTVATNALLERHGARVVLVATAGFEDLLWLRRQDRAALYDLARDHPPPLVARADVVGVAERMGPGGTLVPLVDAEVERVVAAVRALDPGAVAVALLFAFRHAAHEQRLAAALRAALHAIPVVASHEVLPVFREYERTSTVTVEAYLRPRVGAYLARTAAEAGRREIPELRIMTSSGGSLAPAAAAVRAASLALSGPAGGVVGARLVGEAVGSPDLLTLDMGGTSADASLIVGGAPLADGVGAVAGVPLTLPSLLIETVSAGGGSIAWMDDGGALKVGPESAGAVPGPACYGRGGVRPTVTDACLVLGWLDAEQPLAADVRLDLVAAEAAVATLGRVGRRDRRGVAAGIVEVATAAMARALKRVSMARGLDPRRMVLLPFGGAGPLFGCALADVLGMKRVVIPPHSGALSALGLAAAAEQVELMASFHRTFSGLAREDVTAAFEPLCARAQVELPGAVVTREAACRFVGQGYELTIPVADPEPYRLEEAFLHAHLARYGHAGGGQPMELVNLRVVARRPAPPPHFRSQVPGVRAPVGRRPVTVRGERVTADVWPGDELATGVAIDGPAILAGADATALLEPGWRGRVHATGAVLVKRR